MYKDSIIIIPAYNEENVISDLVILIKRLYPGIDILVVNDGSVDNTAKLAAAAGALVLSHPFNMGYGVSLQTGYKYALNGKYDYVVQLDGDGQHDPVDLGALLKNIKDGSCDIVLGSRFLKGDKYKLSIWRLMGILFFRQMLRIFTGRCISDPTTGFQAMNRKILNLFAHDFFPYDYPDADIIALLLKLGFRIKEVPVHMHSNEARKSMHSSPWGAFYYVFKMFLSISLTKLRKYKIEKED